MNLKGRVLRSVLRSRFAARCYLSAKWGAPEERPLPRKRSYNTTLKTEQEWQQAVRELTTLRLAPHRDPPKNWDSLAALHSILERTDTGAAVLDGGADLYSVILPWLYSYGYRNLVGIDTVFQKPVHMGPITYEHGDVTSTRFEAESFDVATCMSVIEHGVDVGRYFAEMERILKDGGLLITSTDYFDEPIDTRGKIAYGSPVHVFSRDETRRLLDVAAEHRLYPTGEVDLECQSKPIHWMGLDYTFLVFALEKRRARAITR